MPLSSKCTGMHNFHWSFIFSTYGLYFVPGSNFAPFKEEKVPVSNSAEFFQKECPLEDFGGFGGGLCWMLDIIISLKPLHTIGKVSLNASILYKNQEIHMYVIKTNLWKFQLISLFLLRENSKDAFSIFVFILMAGVFISWDENSLLDLISLIIRKR